MGGNYNVNEYSAIPQQYMITGELEYYTH